GGPRETVADAETGSSPFLRAALECGAESAVADIVPFAAVSAEPYSVSQLWTVYTQPTLLRIEAARENNLKSLSLSIEHRQLTVVTGVSGSDKSTLAFDIVFAEGQRRFMESMSPYARQFVEQLPRPAVDRLTGIPPTVAIEQRVTRGSRKSTVATI